MKLATLYEGYSSMDFDLETATDAKIILVDTYEQAIEWAEKEVREGRDPSVEWTWNHYDEGVLQGRSLVGEFATECNEEGTQEISFVYVRDIQKNGE